MPEQESRAGALSTPTNVGTKQRFPFLDLQAQFELIRDELVAAVTRVIESQQFIMGPDIAGLEEDISSMMGCEYAIACASGSDALLLCLMAIGVGPGDEVIVPPFTFVATAGSVARLGATPVFADIEPGTFNLNPEQLEARITPRTKAVIPVHLFGLAADMRSILEIAQAKRVTVIEDAAQAIGGNYEGSSVGTLGAFGCFSFFPSKNLGGAGDGGLVTTDDPQLADTLKVLRVHGSRSKYSYEKLGMNSRLDSLQAAILRVKLKYLEAWTASRQQNAQRYRELFEEYGVDQVTLPIVPPGRTHVYNQFTIRTAERDSLKQYLHQRGIPTEIYYPFPLHLQPAFANLRYKQGDLPESERASKEVLSLPIYPELTFTQQEMAVSGIADFFSR